MKLNAMMTRITGAAGSRSQGEMASAWTFCACWSSTPQLIAGGRSPSPRKDNDVSLMTMAGIANVVAAMMWLMKEGTRWLTMIRVRLHPASSAAITNSSSRSERNRPRTTRASSVQPISEMMTVMAK